MTRPIENPPPPSEQVHLPGPTYLPVIVAAGITLVLVGVVFSWWLVAGAMIVTVAAVVRWIRDTRADIADLPLEH